MTGAPPRPVGKQDVEALSGVLSVLLGNLLAGDLDDRFVTSLGRKLARSGVLAGQAGTDQSAGRLAVAVEDLLGRLQYALGELPVEPEPRRDPATLHTLTFRTEADARRAAQLAQQRCQRTAQQSSQRAVERQEVLEATVHAEPAGGSAPEWVLEVTDAGLAPDPTFRDVEELLRKVARASGGRYRGSQAR
jgi:hypothetical protein